MGRNGRKYLEEHFERKKITKQWKDVLEKVGSKHQEAGKGIQM